LKGRESPREVCPSRTTRVTIEGPARALEKAKGGDSDLGGFSGRDRARRKIEKRRKDRKVGVTKNSTSKAFMPYSKKSGCKGGREVTAGKRN